MRVTFFVCFVFYNFTFTFVPVFQAIFSPLNVKNSWLCIYTHEQDTRSLLWEAHMTFFC